MFYQRDLSFLCETFQKSHVPARVMDLQQLLRLLEKTPSQNPFFIRSLSQDTLERMEHNTLYRLNDALSLSYRILLLPSAEPCSFLIIGPFRTETLTRAQLFEVGEKNGIPPQEQRYFTEYYESIPLVFEDTPLWIMLHTFCERIWQTPFFPMKDIASTDTASEPSHIAPYPPTQSEDPLLSMLAIERRYAFENEMIQAVKLGKSHAADRLLSSFSSTHFEKRLADTLRNTKNYCIIMNTLLRKAAESGGVHPMHLDRLSSEFAIKIEELDSTEKSGELMNEMFRAYCRLVQEHSTKALPPLIRKAVTFIDSDLSADLSSSRIAKELKVSQGYLSTAFKQAMHQTLSEYVCKRRMEHAAHLLETTHLQIQTVALHCGILDVQYFSKLFKKELYLTPSQYRKAHQGAKA